MPAARAAQKVVISQGKVEYLGSDPMCGIVGIVASNGHVPAEALERATLSLAHRGPDDSGTVVIRGDGPGAPEIGLGNRRLAVLDLSPLGHQPMCDPVTGNWIVYNGEIYNYKEIRTLLEKDGVQFHSHSDTEVLLKAYGRWGEQCLHRLRGMFAFAVWDPGRRRLFLARDPMGIKPLYYCVAGEYFVFASEIRALLATGLVRPCLDRAGLLNYLTFGSSYDPITLVEGVSSLPPGSCLEWQDGNIRSAGYWNFPIASNQKPERGEFEQELSDLVHQSLQMQMVSDVPVGVFLSGGIDSSSIVAALSRRGAKVNTFSLVFREPEYNEEEYSRAVAKAYGTDHHEILISQKEAMEHLPCALRAMDQPTIDGLNSFVIAQHTRAAGIKVALSGLGADELFGGYSSFRTVPRMHAFARGFELLPQQARRSVARAFTAFAPASDQSRKIAALVEGNGSLIDPYLLSRMLFTPKDRDRLLTESDSNPRKRAHVTLLETLAQSQQFDAINRISYLESRCYMLNTLLRDSDVMSMAHGLELRVPLIDHVLAERLFTVPGTWKLDRAIPKHLLVESVGGLPPEIVHRRKRGFTLPIEHWLRAELRTEAEHSLQSASGGPLSGVLDPTVVREVWQHFLEGKTSWSRPWSLYVLQRWCELNSIAA
jgi:asparagine synthase (glutamine-hydrolysing)